MGNTRSFPDNQEVDIWWSKPVPVKEKPVQNLEEFKLELARKHEKRRQLIAEKRQEMEELREEVKRLKEENELLRRQNPNNLTSDLMEIRRKNRELQVMIAEMQNELQELNAQAVNFEKERIDYKTHVIALKDVIAVSKQMLLIREGQLKELREKIEDIEATLAGKEMQVLSQDLRAEYQRQLQNIRNLRVIYEDRQRADRIEKEQMKDLLDETKKQLEDEKKRNMYGLGN